MSVPPIAVDGATISLAISSHRMQLLVVSSTGRSHVVRYRSEEEEENRCDVRATYTDVVGCDIPVAAAFIENGNAYSVVSASSLLITRCESEVRSVSICDRLTSSTAWVRNESPVSLEALHDNDTCSLIGFGHGATIWDDRSSAVTWGTEPLPRGASPERLIGATSVQGPVVALATFDGYVLSYDVRAGTGARPFAVARIENDTVCCVASRPLDRSIVLGGALGKIYVCRVSHSPQLEQCISTGKHRSLIRSIATNTQQVFSGHFDGRVTASTFCDSADNSAPPLTSVSSLERAIGRHRISGAGAAPTVSAMSATDEMVWVAFSENSASTGAMSTIIATPADAATGLVTL